MTTGANRILDDFAKLMTDAAGAAQGVRKEAETVFRAQAERLINGMDLVKREEFEVVREMAIGALLAAKADYALSISGIAGPGGGSEEKPVGTVWFGLADKQHIWARQAHFGGSRSEVRAQAVQFALAFLLEKVQESAAA